MALLYEDKLRYYQFTVMSFRRISMICSIFNMGIIIIVVIQI